MSTTAIFAGVPGQVVSMGSDEAGKFFAMSFAAAASSGIGQSYQKAVDYPGIVLSTQISHSVSAQVMTSLADTVHATGFGDKPGTLGVSVLLNGSACGKSSGSQTSTGGAGTFMANEVQSFNRFYRDYRLNSSSAAGTRPGLLVVGLESYRGYLLNGSAKVESGAVPMAVGSLQFAVWFNSTV